ncbi:hypothetical protein G9A89_000366, partial [Geosiphon pyriformis]
MIVTFGFLKCHESHRHDMIFMDAGTPTRSTLLQKASASIKECHFVVMQLKLYPDFTTVVYDGMSKQAEQDLLKWKGHKEYITTQYGITRTENNHKWIMDFGRNLTIEQANDYVFGPITCWVLWELSCPGKFDETCGVTVMGEGEILEKR